MEPPIRKSHDKESTRRFNGLALYIAVLRTVDPIFRQALLAKISKVSPMLARLADHTEFLYRDLIRLDSRSAQIVLATIPEADWLLAWKLSDEATKAFLLENMSERRRQIFLDAAKNTPKVPRRRVIVIQMRIGRQILRMLSEGKLGLRSRRGP